MVELDKLKYASEEVDRSKQGNVSFSYLIDCHAHKFSNYYLLTGCKGRTRKYKPQVFHTARACEGCLENQGLVFLGTARVPS